MMTQPRQPRTIEEQRENTINGLKERFISGKYFADTAWNERINARRDSRPPTPYRYWANAVEVMGEMAGTGAVFAQIAAQIIKEMPLYQTDRELRAKVFETVGSVISEGYDDVALLAGFGGPAKPSQCHRAFTVEECILIDLWLYKALPQIGCVNEIGWVMRKLAQEYRIPLGRFEK